jgi:hypothetical protein
MLTAASSSSVCGRRRHGVELHGREGELGERRRGGLRPRAVSPTQPVAAPVIERLLVDASRDLADAGDGADRRDRRQPPADLALGLVGHQIAASASRQLY